MLTTNELKRYAHLRRLRLVDQIWKDYLQDLVLHVLYGRAPALVFRGDTCIWKLYRGDRLSEDLDMCAGAVPDDVGEHVARELGYLGFDCAARGKRTGGMEYVKLSVSSPAHPRPVTLELQVEILRSEECYGRSSPATLYPPYPDIPPVELRAQAVGDIATDKVSAIHGRDKPRDVHDLYTLMRQGVRPDMAEVRRRVPGFTLSGLRGRMEQKRRDWRTLQPLVVGGLPSLDEEMRYIIAGLRG